MQTVQNYHKELPRLSGIIRVHSGRTERTSPITSERFSPQKPMQAHFPAGAAAAAAHRRPIKNCLPFLCEAIARTADRLPNPSGPRRTVQGFLDSRQCRVPPPFHDIACFLFAHFSLKRQKAQGRRNCPCSRLLHTKPPRLPSRKPGRFVCFRGAFSGAHAKPCEGSFGKPRVCGESATPWHSTPVLWDHPRVCGGKGHLTLAVSHMHRINPAYAGKRESRQQDHTITWDHPRVCGEKARTLIVQNEPQGSPPRMRGKD